MSTSALLLGASTGELTLRMVVSLVVMGLAALAVTKLARSRLRLGGERAGIAVHARHQLTRSASVAVIRAGDRWLLVGVTDANVTVLAEGADLADEPAAAGPASDERAPRSPHHRARAADGTARRGAGKRHQRAPDGGPGRSRTSLIEALREKTVRR